MTDLFRDASFFGGCEPKNSDKTDVAENSLVLVSFRISVWTGMSTEQTSVEGRRGRTCVEDALFRPRC